MERRNMERDDELLAIEYQKAQDSAEHHDSLLWNVTSIMWAGNLVLFGFIINYIKDNNLNYIFRILLLSICFLGIAFVWCLGEFASAFRSVRNQKYDRCKKIEKELNKRTVCELKYITQHTNLEYTKGSQKGLYDNLNLFFIIVWIIISLIIIYK